MVKPDSQGETKELIPGFLLVYSFVYVWEKKRKEKMVKPGSPGERNKLTL